MEVVDGEDTNREHVAGLRPFDEDRTAHRVRARATLRHALLYRLQRLGDVRLRNAR